MTAVVLGLKVLKYELYLNSYSEKGGGIQTLAEFDFLESSFLYAIGWVCRVSTSRKSVSFPAPIKL